MAYLTKEQEKLYAENQKLVYWFLKITGNMDHYDTDELIGFLQEGLLKAAKEYDGSSKFSTYAYYKLKQYYRNYNYFIRNKSYDNIEDLYIEDPIDYYNKFEVYEKMFLIKARMIFTKSNNYIYTKFLDDVFNNIIYNSGYSVAEIARINNIGTYYKHLYSNALVNLKNFVNQRIFLNKKLVPLSQK